MARTDDFVKIIVLTFASSILWTYSESFNLVPKYYNENSNITLARFRRQDQSQACIGDSSKFQCSTTADCIDADFKCDGKLDCPDGSDEKESLCKNIFCPGYLFKCDYGACISGDQKCDGIKNCNDNSDEVNCPVTNRVNTNCRSDQFECSNGQCIEIDGKCNGVADCEDKSDETEETCLNIYCPGYTYKCKYGACVDGDAECNNIKDCIDGSDEKNCEGPTTSPVLVSGKKCTTPNQPEHGQWVYLTNHEKGPTNIQVDTNTVIVFSCKERYKLSSTNELEAYIACLDGQWSLTVMPTCLKTCPAIYSSKLVTVSCRTDGSVVQCDKATDGTDLTFKCAPYYEPVLGRAERSFCYDGTWSYTPECIPVCGEKRVTATPLIVNGHEVERGNYPWVVALYSNKDSDTFFTNICGGSLLTTNIVLTAAHCVTKKETGKIYNVKYFRIAAGKYYNRFDDKRDNDTAQFSEVEEIAIHQEYQGEVQNFRGDIALLKLKTVLSLSKVVQPVCYNSLPPLKANTIGLVNGWGYTTTTGEPSDTLKELELPFNEREQCYAQLDEDFAKRYFINDKICAGFYNLNTSVCKGDSGGGLVFKNPSYYSGRFFVHGVVSIAHSYTKNQEVHCNIQRGALFTSVEKYSEWIQRMVRRWSSKIEIR